MLAFRGEAHVDAWSAEREIPRGAILSLEQAWRLAEAWYRDRLSLGRRRRTARRPESTATTAG